MTKNKGKIILIDADVVSHFITGGQIIALPHIFTNPVKILDKVYKELERMPGKLREVRNLIDMKLLEQIPFPEDNEEIKKEYYHIKNMLFKGDGESACLAVARYQNNIIASSNLKDIKVYCDMHSILYLTTMDFLCEALRKGRFDLQTCNEFISKVLAKGSKLPVTNMNDYTCKEFKL